LLHEPKQNIAAVVDPAEAEPVLQKLQELGAELVAIFNTHHHDHVGGNQQLLQRFGAQSLWRERIGKNSRNSGVFARRRSRPLCRSEAEIIFVPGHTRAHIYHFAPRKLE